MTWVQMAVQLKGGGYGKRGGTPVLIRLRFWMLILFRLNSWSGWEFKYLTSSRLLSKTGVRFPTTMILIFLFRWMFVIPGSLSWILKEYKCLDGLVYHSSTRSSPNLERRGRGWERDGVRDWKLVNEIRLGRVYFS